MPEFKSFFDQLATFCRIVVFDKAGVGLSDPVPHVRTLDDRAAEIEAVMDAVGFGRAVLFGFNDGGFASIVFAATRLERTRALILADSFSFLGVTEGWDDVERDPAKLWARLVPELGEDYVPSVEQITRMQEIGRAVRSGWGSGAMLSITAPSAAGRLPWLAMFERMCASPGMARASLEAGVPDRRAADPADDHRANPGDPCPRGPRRSGAVRPVPRRPHSRRAVPRGRQRGTLALVKRSRHDPDRDRGVPHRQSCGTGPITPCPAHRAVHRHRRIDATRGDHRRRAVAGGAATLS